MFNSYVTKFGPLIARILIGGMFLMAGINKIFAFPFIVEFIGVNGLPIPEVLAVLAIAIEILGGLSLIIGYRIQYSAYALIAFTIIVSAVFHADFTNPGQVTLFTKNMAILGGLLYMAAFGAGSLSLKMTEKAAPETTEPEQPMV